KCLVSFLVIETRNRYRSAYEITKVVVAYFRARDALFTCSIQTQLDLLIVWTKRAGGIIQEGVGIESVVSQELVEAAVKILTTATGDEVHYAASGLTEFSSRN